MPRYIFNAGRVRVYAGKNLIGIRELWIGVESYVEIDISEFSREHGYDLIDARGLSVDELASVGITSFETLPLQR